MTPRSVYTTGRRHGLLLLLLTMMEAGTELLPGHCVVCAQVNAALTVGGRLLLVLNQTPARV